MSKAYAIWLAAYQTYASKVNIDGKDLDTDDFKGDPQG